MKHGLIAKNVCTLERAPKIETEEVQILTLEQVDELPSMLHGHPLEAPALVSLHTGMRRGELLALRWGNVDLENEVIRVRESLEQTRAGLRFKGPKTKAGRRDITLPAAAVDLLQAHRKRELERRLMQGQGRAGQGRAGQGRAGQGRAGQGRAGQGRAGQGRAGQGRAGQGRAGQGRAGQGRAGQGGQGRLTDGDLVFPAWNGTPWAPNSFGAAWSKLSSELELGVSFHALRHTHASYLLHLNVDPVTISKRLGHSSPAVTLSIYAHLIKQDDRKAANAINAALKG